jgi:DNA repair exonuclease SbcCD nuclease subunit
MKFLHAADIHLGSPLTGLRAREDLPAELIKDATQRAFVAMVDLALAEDVAFVVIAGDLFDGDWKDFSTGLFFAAQMRRLARPCFLLRGNHDARSQITSSLPLPANVREFSSKICETFLLDELGVALHGQSFPTRAVPEKLVNNYPARAPGLFNIGVLHTSAEKPGEHAVYAPCSVADMELKGYDYWALGHIHIRQELSTQPYMVFPGNLQGRHAKETGPKGCTLVSVEDGRISAVEHHSVDVLRWASIEVDVTGADRNELSARVAKAAQLATAAAEGRPLLMRCTLTGATALHGELLGDTEALAAECRNAAIAVDAELWVERMLVCTTPPLEDRSEALGALHDAFLLGLDDDVQVQILLSELVELRQKLPAIARNDLTLPENAQALRSLAEEAWQLTAASLRAADPA